MGEVVKLVPSTVSKDTVDELIALLHEARAGEIVGIAYVALHPGQVFTADFIGHARTASIFTLGAIRFLSDHIVDTKDPKPPR